MLPRQLRYVPLGDSYTIGTGVAPQDRWPDRLAARLAASVSAPSLTLVGNLAVNGWTSADVLMAGVPRLWPLMPEFASLLVGVNDVVQGVPVGTYRRTVETILDALLVRLPAARLVTVSTPDYTITPRGADYGRPASQAAAIRAVNTVMAEASAARSIAHVDIHDLSLLAAEDRGLVAEDGLHPSGAQYARWVDRVAPVVERLLDPGG